MQHQILGLRDYIAKNGELKKKDTFYEKKWAAQDLKDIFKNPDQFLKDIPKEEQYNLYFTVAASQGRREFLSQKYIPFDIDGIDVKRARETISAALMALGLKWENTLSLFSGNGVQFFVELHEPFTDPNYFDENRVHYKSCCERINKALKEADLPGDADSSVFSMARLMRFPKTLNVKPDKPKRMAEVLQAESVPTAFSLAEASGIPRLAKEEVLAKWPPPDTDAVLAGCLNLKMMLDQPDKVPEPLWYANASIVGHLGTNPAEGRKIWHDYSAKYKKYDAREADRKLEQALAASGPRTCANFSSLPGSRCGECPHFKKIKSPILIQGPNYIRTKASGFHHMETNAEGKVVLGRPNYEDLLKWFEQEHPYVTNAVGGQIYTFEKTHYNSFSPNEVKAFAEKWFQHCNQNKAGEFYQKVVRNNLVKPEWFPNTSENQMNFLNGVLDIKTMKFTEGHPRDKGFMYVLPYNYDATEDAPRFSRYLEEVTKGDKELQKTLLEFGGYCLSNDEYWEHKALLLVGSGRNGKSVFLEVMASIAENAFSTVSMRNLQDVQHVATLEGKLFNLSEESSSNSFRETDMFKALTTGGQITVKTVYEKPYQIRNRAKLIFSCNELPSSADKSFGFYSRFAIVPFDAVFTRENRDPLLIQKLKAERAGILNMMLEAYREMKHRGYMTQSARGDLELEQYKTENDSVLQWIKEHVTVLPRTQTDEKYTAVSELYNSYKNFCDIDGVRAMPRVPFSKRLGAILPDVGNRHSTQRVDNKPARVIMGVVLDRSKDSF